MASVGIRAAGLLILVAFAKEPDITGGENLVTAQETPHGAAAHDPPQNPGPSIRPGGGLW
jgi:hypothetical protein